MPLLLQVFLVLATLLAVQSIWALVDGYRFLRYFLWSRRRPLEDFAPPGALLIACKGTDEGFERNVAAYLRQDYPQYQVIFAVATEDDPAYRRLQAQLRRREESSSNGKLRASLVVAGLSDARGEKVNNLLHGLAAVDPKAEVLVFADIDAHPARDWLHSLVAPLKDPRVTVSTGFRWYLPGAGFVAQLRAAWDTSVATMLGDHANNFAWGGSMAIRAADFRRLQVAERYWAATVSDDYAMTRAVKEAGGWIRFEPRCLLASREQSSFREFFAWANRQIIITRVYSSNLWRMGIAAYVFYCGTMLLGLGVLLRSGISGGQKLLSAAIMLAILLLGIEKARVRSTVAREQFPEEAESLRRYGACYWQLSPLVPWVMLANCVVAGFTRRIEWRGVHYDLRSRDEVRVLKRDEV